MPYIQCKNKVFNVSANEALFLEVLKERLNYCYSPVKLNYSGEDLISYYLANEENFIQAIQSKLDNFNPIEHEDSLRDFERLAGYPVTRYLSTKTDGKYAMYNTHNTFFNILFAYFIMKPIGFKKIVIDNLKDKSILTPIKDVIKDKRILSLIYPNGYDKITVYDFLKIFSFTVYKNDGLCNIEGIGPVSLAKINQSLSNFGYPLLFGDDLYSINRNIGYTDRLEKLLLLTKEDMEKLNFSQSFIEKLQSTKYINNRKTLNLEQSIEEKTSNATAPTSENVAKKETQTQTKEHKEQEKQSNQNNKYLGIISKMPKSIIKNMVIKEFNSNLNLLLDLGKENPQILLDYAECIPFKKYKNVDSIKEVLNIISIQPKLIRKLEKRMIAILMTSQPLPMHNIIYSDKLTKAESVSLNAYVSKVVAERLSTKKETIKNR